MPLWSIKGEQALETRKANPVAYWGTRSTANRVEPIARPAFYPSFTFDKGEKIFTIGSCFARNVETELMKRGFEVPVRQLMADPLFNGLEISALNNYGTPSIYNELVWAFDPERPFVPSDHLLEIKSGQVVDLHLSGAVSPASWEIVVARRAAIQKLMRLSAECRVVIMTLGLAEVWFDTATGYYLNEVVRPTLLRLHPGRFELHVLSFQEAFEFLDKALLLLRKNGHPDLRVILTVSPVPLYATHRPADVMVANTYSKSMLRTVAEAICASYNWVDYYPSYEAIVLSERRSVWEADLVHVTNEAVALNVGRMLERYLSTPATLDGVRERLATGGRLVAEDLARTAREKAGEYAAAFFEEFGSWSATSPAFAVEHARFLVSGGDDEGAIRVLSGAPSGAEPLAVGLVKAEAELRLGRDGDAVATLLPLIPEKLKSQPAWELLVRAYAKGGDPAPAIAATQRYIAAMNPLRPSAILNLARALREGHPRIAAYYYELVIDDFLDTYEWIQYEIADFLVQQQRFDPARRMLEHLKPGNADLAKRVSALKELVGVGEFKEGAEAVAASLPNGQGPEKSVESSDWPGCEQGPRVLS